MVKQIIGETFEQLGKTAGQVVKQVVQEPGKMAEKAVEQVGIKPATGAEETPKLGLTPEELRRKEQEKQRRLAQLRVELKAVQQKQAQELPKQISGKPGFSKEQAIKQIELQKEQKEKLPPPVAAAKQKGGTGERKIMGISG